MSPTLSLPQALLLLTLKDETGRPKAGFYKPAIAGAALSELLLSGAITLTDDKKPKVIVSSDAQSNSPFLMLCLEKIRATKKPRDMTYWASKLGQTKYLIPTLAQELCELGALREETSKVLGVFTMTSWPEASPELESTLKQQLETALFGTGDVDEHTCVLIALAKSADVLRYNFDRKALKAHKERIKAITTGDLLAAGATDKAIKAAQTAMIAAVSAAVVTTTVAS
ncbi:MAG: GPP34 family phosphoprotein [Pseudomonadota bacterium]